MNDNGLDYDVAIVGGGLVGASLACALSPTPLRVVVIEAVLFKSDAQPSYDERMLALSHGSKQILSTMGIWPAVAAGDATPIERIHISDRGRAGFTRLSHRDAGVEALGFVVPARVLGQVLIGQLEISQGVEVLCPGRVAGIVPGEQDIVLTVVTGGGERELRVKLAVLADGGRSPARESLGITATVHDYGQTAILTTVTPGHAHRHVAYERFTDSGPLALLPTSGNRYAVVWTTRHECVETLMNLSDQRFIAALQRRFGDRAGRLSKPGRRQAHRLTLVRVPNPVACRALAIGNAAHTIHPVSGQGFNLGVRDVAVLAEVLHGAAKQGEDIGSAVVLSCYAERRRRDTLATTLFTDGLVRLFSNTLPPVAWARDAAMVAVDVLPPVKRFLLHRTMGIAGRLPQLARGLPFE